MFIGQCHEQVAPYAGLDILFGNIRFARRLTWLLGKNRLQALLDSRKNICNWDGLIPATQVAGQLFGVLHTFLRGVG